MKRASINVFVLLLGAASTVQEGRACTTFAVEGEEGAVIGKSYDWSIGSGMVFFNKAGVAKRALSLDPRDTPAHWSSRYASLTFNQYGREFPNGGMNMAGLVVEVMWLGAAQAAPKDERATLNELQWIQLQLDRFETVAEVVAHVDKFRISPVYGQVHYMACDRSGECAAIEHLAGRDAVVTTGRDMLVKALTNDTYADSVGYLSTQRGFGGDREPPQGSGSLARFARTGLLVSGRKIEPDRLTAYALEVLDDVRSGDFTKWNIVYDPQRLEVSFRTLGNPALKAVRLEAFDTSCLTPVRALDIDTAGAGDVSASFVDYSMQANERLIRSALEGLGIDKVLPAGTGAALALLPGSYQCAASGQAPLDT